MKRGRRAAPAVLLSTIIYRPSPLNGKALDTRDRLWRAKEFWRRREPTLGRRCDVAVNDHRSDGVWFRGDGRGGACSCLGRDLLGFGAGISTRVADLANSIGEGATVSCSSAEWCNDRRLHDKHHRGPPKISANEDQPRFRRAAKARCAVPMSNMPLQRTKACQLSVDGQRAGAARLFK